MDEEQNQRFERRTITPEVAAEMLASNTHNRRLAASAVDRYARTMRSGLWRCTMAEPITFDANGVLQEGQHRLAAVVQSGVTVDVWVAFGAEPDDFTVVGTGRKRSVADTLGIDGYTNTRLRQTAARLVLLYMRYPDRTWSNSRTAPLVDLEILREARRSVYDAALAYGTSPRTNVITRSTLVAHAALVMEHSSYASELDAFSEALQSGAGLAAGSPILTLRNWYINGGSSAGSGSSWAQQRRMAIHVRAWNAWVEGQELKLLKFNVQNLPMPRVK